MSDRDPEVVVAEGIRVVSDEFFAETGCRPTVDELIEIFDAQWGGDLRASLGWTEGTMASRVSGLNDAAFVAASDLVLELERRTVGAGARRADIVGMIVQGIRSAADDVAQASPPDSERSAGMAKRPPLNRGDIVAIPVSEDKYRLAVVLEKDRFGVAYGALEGVAESPSPTDVVRRPADRPIYSGDESVSSGRWQIVGHDESLPDLFDEPEIFHRPSDEFPDDDIGQFGAAEKADGTLRQLTEAEAQAVGLFDPDYQQVLLPNEVEQRLAR